MTFALRLLTVSLLLLVLVALAGGRQAAAQNLAPAPASNLHTDPFQEAHMSSSTLTPDNLPAGPDRRIHQGHGTSALGPSDSSDSGSDLSGTSGPDIGDADLDSDTDAEGTGERAAAGRDKASRESADIDADHVERIVPPLDDAD